MSMIAIDTNVLLRVMLEGDPVQTPVARRLLSSEAIYVPATVLLEAAWSLRTRSGRTRAEIARALSMLVAASNVSVQEPHAVASALAWTEQGLDIADALHLATAQQCSAFLTFDDRFIRRASRVGSIPVRAP